MKDEQLKDEETFREDQIPIAAFKVACENNAMLRLILHNQNCIMEKLGIEQTPPYLVYNDVAPIEKKVELANENRLESNIHGLSMLIRDRTWEWVNLRVNIVNDSKESEGEGDHPDKTSH